MKFGPTDLSTAERQLRIDIRKLLDEELHDRERPVLGMTGGHDPQFSRMLGERGFIGMAIPEAHGGQGRSAVERFIVTEELLAAGAPITAHWGSDRQIGPSLVSWGNDEQRSRMLPAIVRGELYFSLGMSEPDAGSDLASVRTTATRAQDGWLVNGTKIWTSYADRNHYFMVLCRTSPGEDRHDGLSQLMVDLASPGIEVREIEGLDPHHAFHEVVMTDVFVPDEMVLGEVGMGWQQVTSELTLERAGPDRYMSAYPLIEVFVRDRLGSEPEPDALRSLGGLFARLWGVRQLSLSVSRSLDHGYSPAVEAALVKDLGSTLEQETVDTLRRLVDDELDPGSTELFGSLAAEATMAAPSYTIRGGTVEILRGVASKGLGREGGRGPLGDEMLQETVERLFTDLCPPEALRASEAEGWAPEVWESLCLAGVPTIGIPEAAGGAGGAFADTCAALRLAGYFAAPVPLVETNLAAWMLADAGLPLADGAMTVGSGRGDDVLTLARSGSGWRVDGVLHRVGWAERAERIVALAEGDAGDLHVVSLRPALATISAGRNLADEPRSTVTFAAAPLDDADVAPAPPGVDRRTLLARGALMRSVLIGGACQAATDLAVTYATDRVQFGRPIARFQAVQHHLVRSAAESALASNAAAVAALLAPADQAVMVGAAKVIAGRAARAVAGATHQVHGAIGMTREYELHHRTRRLWSWADEWGSERWWAGQFGTHLVTAGAPGLRPLLTVAPEPGT